MQILDKYNSNLGTAILLTGPSGGGKTVLGCRLFPKTYVFIADPNFASGKRYLEKINDTSNIVGFDNGYLDDAGKAIPTNKRYENMLAKIDEVSKSDKVDAVFMDSATFIEDFIKAKICGATSDEKIKLGGFDQWGLYLMTWKSLIMQLRQSGKKVIVSAHEWKERDESDGIWKYEIALDGQIRQRFPNIFSDVWRCEVREVTGKPHEWWVRCLGNVRQEHLKNNYSLAGEMKQDELVKQIKEMK